MAVLVEEAVTNRTPLAIPAGVLAQAWRAAPARLGWPGCCGLPCARWFHWTSDPHCASGPLGAATGMSDVVDVSVAICARDRGHAVVTTDAADLRAIDPSIPLLTP